MPIWNIDPDHSVAAFTIEHMMIAKVHGQFNKITGTIQFDPENIADTSIEFEIDVDSIITGVKKRDDHLKSSDFFYQEKYPKIIFKSSKAERSGFNRCKVSGDLTIHGVTKQVTVDVEFFGSVKSPFGETSMGFTAKTILNREDFEIKWNEQMENDGFMIGKDVQIFVDLEADLVE
jgi:polyisoprenoid-binding protein YceI